MLLEQNSWLVLLVIFIIGLLLSPNQQENFISVQPPDVNRLMKLYNKADDKGLKIYIQNIRKQKNLALRQALRAKKLENIEAHFNRYLFNADLLNLIRLAIRYRSRDKDNNFEKYLTNMGLYVSKEQRKEWRRMDKLLQKQWDQEFRLFLQDDDYMVEEEPTEPGVEEIEIQYAEDELGPCKECGDEPMPLCRYGSIPRQGPERMITQEDGSQCFCPGFYQCPN